MSPALELGSLSLAPPGKPPSNISLSNSCVPSVLLLLVFDHLCCQFPGLIPEVNSGVNVPVTCWVSHTGQLAFPQSTNLVHKSWPSCGLRFVKQTRYQILTLFQCKITGNYREKLKEVWGMKKCCRLVAIFCNNTMKNCNAGYLTFTRIRGLEVKYTCPQGMS